jgi:3-hydroxybutyryl-CoA dehydrogenase
MSEIKTVGIVGSGLMGTGIAEVASASGYRTILVKATGGDCDAVKGKIGKSLKKAVEKNRMTQEQSDRAMGLLTCTADRSALAGADIVIESIVEDLATKRALFEGLNRILPEDAIFASNTSTLRITELARGLRGDRTIGLHFFSPVPAMKLVELAHTTDTSAEVLKSALDFTGRLGKTAVPVLDSTGFVVNRLLVPYLVGAIAAYEQGLAKPDEIDTAMKLGCGHPMGPLALSDLIGLDVVYAMAKLLYADFHDVRYKPPALLRAMVQQGMMGRKAGKGFFDYSVDPPKPNDAIPSRVELSSDAAER